MEKRPVVIFWIQLLLFATVFLVPLFSLNYLAYSVIEKTLLFYALVEVAFGLWIYVALQNRSYLPPRDLLLIVGGVFIAIYTLAGVLASSPELAFWSTMTRMTGLIMLFHVAAFLVMLLSVLRDEKSWRRVMGLVAISGALIALPMHTASLWGREGGVVKATFGNDSYTAAYLTFSFFLLLILYFQAKTRQTKFFFALCALLIIFSPVFLSLSNLPGILSNPVEMLGTARAATMSIFLGLLLSVLAYLASLSRKVVSRVGSVVFVGLFATVVSLSAMVFVPNGAVQQNLADVGIGSRLVFWDSAGAGIREKPFLGFGPENYSVPFYQHFDSVLLTAEYGYEVYTSKPHSSYLEVLVSGGVLSFIPYMAIWGVAFFWLWRIWRERRLSPMETALLIGLLCAYLIQNLVLFDTLSSYMGVGVLIAYLVYVQRPRTSVHVYPTIPRLISWPKVLIGGGVMVVMGYFFVLMPALQQITLMDVLEEATVMERAGMYDDLFAISPGMRTSMAEYIMAKALGAVPPALGSATADQKDMILKDVAALRETAELYADTNSVHYRHTLYLARLHLLEFVLEPDKDKRAELLATVQKLEMTLEDLSPKNPQNNWVKAQRELFLGETLEALQTLQMADEYAPGIVSTKDKIEQVEAFLSGEGNIPFFTD